MDRSGKVPLRFGQVWMDGEVATETDIVGAFDIEVDRNIDRLVLTFTDPKFSAFHESTKVLHLNTQKSSLSYSFTAPLMQKDAAKVEEDNTITMTFRNIDIAKLKVPDTADLENMQIYGNIVSQSIFGPTYKDIIGDSFTVDDSGLEQPITVVVLMCLTFSDESKEAVDVPGSYTFSFKKSYIQV